MAKIDFRKLIKAGLKRQKMSIYRLAELVGVKSQTLYNYMAGRSEMTAANLERIFEVLKIKIL